MQQSSSSSSLPIPTQRWSMLQWCQQQRLPLSILPSRKCPFRHCSTCTTSGGGCGWNTNQSHHNRSSLTTAAATAVSNTTYMERMVDIVNDGLEMLVYWIGPILIALALSIVTLLCYTFLFILLPMIYEKHHYHTFAETTTQLQLPSLYTYLSDLFYQSRPYIVVTFHCFIVLILVTNVLYNYACCVLQSHVGDPYESVIQELANITNTTLPQSSQELLSYRRQLSQLLSVRMKEQQQQQQRSSSSSTMGENSSNNSNHTNELTQRRTITSIHETTATTTTNSITYGCHDPLHSQQQVSSTMTSNGGTVSLTQPSGTSTTNTPSSSSSSPPSVLSNHPPNHNNNNTTKIRAWMLLGPYEWGYCSQTNQPKPPRSHYDHVTKQLILNLDHYCPWMFNAVGYFNYRYFVNFLIFTFLGMLYGAILMFEPFLLLKSHNYRHQNALLQQKLSLQQIKGTIMSKIAQHELQPRLQPMMPYRDEKMYLTLSFMLCVAVGVALIGLGGFHMYLVSTGQTTIEFHGNWAVRRRYEQIAATTATSTNGTKKKHRWQNPYSRGTILANWQQVYGVSTVPFLKRIGCGCSDRSYINLLFCILIPHRRLPEYLPVPVPGQSTLRSVNATKLSSHGESNNGEVPTIGSRYRDESFLV